MSEMMCDRQKLYLSADDFFRLNGSVAMKLSSDAAVQVCERSSSYGLIVGRFEGGIWHSPGFEARIDCIWDGLDPPLDTASVIQNNINAANFIRLEAKDHDAFIITNFLNRT